MESTTVLIVDDHPLYRRGTREALDGTEDIKVVDAVGTAEAALDRVSELRPDVVLLDINLPDASGVDVAKQIRSSYPETGIIALTAYDDDAFILALARAGVRGYLLKTATDAEIVSSVRAVSAGGSVFATAVTESVTPGPAVTAATPGFPVTRVHPSAAWAADCSWRTSTTRIPSSMHPS